MATISPTVRKMIFFGVAIIIAIFFSVRENRNIDTTTIDGIDTVRCVFALGVTMYDLDGMPEELNYEMIKRFVGESGKSFEVSKTKSDDVWSVLLDGECDIVIYDLLNGIPEDVEPLITYSTQTKDEIVWIVKRENHSLLVSINNWLRHFTHSDDYFKLISRYYRSYRIEPYINQHKKMVHLSPYDDLVKKYSDLYGVDWRLITSIIYQESRFHLSAQSHKDAQGLMQLTSGTAARFGATDPIDPEQNIMAGTQYISYLLNYFNNEDIDQDNRLKFALAAYNAGERRISNMRTLADSLDLDNMDWEDVKNAFDSTSSFSGKETKLYVDNVLERYNKYLEVTTINNSEVKIKEDDDNDEQNNTSEASE